jgi:hypothetical protein
MSSPKPHKQKNGHVDACFVQECKRVATTSVSSPITGNDDLHIGTITLFTCDNHKQILVEGHMNLIPHTDHDMKAGHETPYAGVV